MFLKQKTVDNTKIVRKEKPPRRINLCIRDSIFTATYYSAADRAISPECYLFRLCFTPIIYLLRRLAREVRSSLHSVWKDIKELSLVVFTSFGWPKCQSGLKIPGHGSDALQSLPTNITFMNQNFKNKLIFIIFFPHP